MNKLIPILISLLKQFGPAVGKAIWSKVPKGYKKYLTGLAVSIPIIFGGVHYGDLDVSTIGGGCSVQFEQAADINNEFPIDVSGDSTTGRVR